MNTYCTLLLSLLVFSTLSLPFRDQISLLNSLQVGREQQPLAWQCYGCDQSNKPLKSHVIEQKAKDVRAILSVYDQYTVLAFRYTASAQNIWQDLLYTVQVQDQNAPKGCKVQNQYDNMWNSIRTDVIKDLANNAHTRRLIITGISLGGGLAALSYVDINQAGLFQKIQLVTFGAPKVGNNDWAKWFNNQILTERYFLKGDPVPGMPTCLTPLCTYSQTGSGIECDLDLAICKFVSSSQWKIRDISLQRLGRQALQYLNQRKQQNGGVIDHITNYKLIKDFTLVQ